MKRYLSILFFIFGYSFVCQAQNKVHSNFLFSEYKDALIFYKDGRQFTAPVNFDLLNGHYLFIDAKDKQPKQFAFPEKISFLLIDSRNFLLSEGEAVEVLQADPLFEVSYSGNLRRAPKNLTYGGTTQTAAVDSYGGYSGNANLSSQQQTVNKVVVGVNKVYKCQIGNKTKRFHNRSSFLKAFPKHQRIEVEKYLNEKEIDFEDVQKVWELYKYVVK